MYIKNLLLENCLIGLYLTFLQRVVLILIIYIMMAAMYIVSMLYIAAM